MGTMTLSDFESELHYQLAKRADQNPADPDAQARLDRWVNRGLRWVGLPMRHRHPELQKNQTITLVNGTVRYALPADVYALRFVVNETIGFKYDPQQDVDFYDTNTGAARLYAREGRSLLLRGDSSNAGNTVRLYYWAKPVALAAAGDKSELADYFDEVILQRATALGCAALRDLDGADFYNNAAAELVNDYANIEKFEVEDVGWKAPRIRSDSGPMGTR